MAKQFLKFSIALLIAVAIVIAVRMFAFAVCTAPSTIGHDVKAGAKVWVNKLQRCQNLKRGNLVVFTAHGEEAPVCAIIGPQQEMGKVIAVPGDTITLKNQKYRIPYKCCERCLCTDCCLYLVDTGQSRRLMHKHQIIGKAYKIFQ